jgi:aminomethyltransferase
VSTDEAMGQLQTSPLHERHVAAGARFAAFGGWSMPVEYAGGGVLAEHAAVRESVGLFDVSHLGKVSVTGPGAVAFVNTVLTGDLGRIGAGQAQYTLLCNPDGGVVDDLIAYVTGPDDVLLVPNAANAAAVAATLAAAAPDGVVVADRHHDLAVLALQGPRADEVLAAAGIGVALAYMAFAALEVAGAEVVVCRTGYTGERGYELLVPTAAAPAVWDALVAAGAPFGLRAAGLGARDTLRTEMGYPLHGQDLSATITAVQARVGWAVGWTKPAFQGAEALRAEKEAGPSRVLRGLRAEGRGIPRAGMTVRDAEGTEVGTVTSGTFSPTLKTGIALALLDASVTEGSGVSVDVRSRREPFRVVRPPFVESHVR